MKRLPVVILLVVAVLVTVVAGCGGMRRHDARLTAADSLMQSDPDSAMAIVEAVCRDSLASDADRAYRDLLLTQARYRCYIPATSDSDISRALAWYRVHDGEREKLTRALIYKGAVMEELSRPDSAMLYYKQAEATAAPDDYFNLGYVNLRIGALYRIHYANSQTGFDKYKQALRYFSLTGDSAMQQCCLYNMAMFHAIISENCQNRYLDQAISIATLMHDSLAIYDCLELRCRQLIIRDTALVEAKSLARKCLSDYSGYITADLLLDLAEAYAKLGNCDSARFFIEYVDENNVAAERIRIRIRKNDVLSIIAAKDNAKSGSSEFLARSHISSDSLLNNKTKNRIESIENSYNSSKNRVTSSRIIKLRHFIFIIAGILICVLILWAVTSLRKRRRMKSYMLEIEQAARDRNLLLLQRVSDNESVIGHFVKHFIEMSQNLFNDRTKGNAPEITYMIESILKESQEDEFWKGLRLFLDSNYHNVITEISTNPKITEKDLRFIELCCCGFSYLDIAFVLGYSPRYISNKRKYIAGKLGIDISLQDYLNKLMRI